MPFRHTADIFSPLTLSFPVLLAKHHDFPIETAVFSHGEKKKKDPWQRRLRVPVEPPESESEDEVPMEVGIISEKCFALRMFVPSAKNGEEFWITIFLNCKGGYRRCLDLAKQEIRKIHLQ